MSNGYIPSLASLGITGAGLIVYYVFIFVAVAIAMFQLNRKAGYRHAWMAFIPGLSDWALLRVIKVSPWNMAWFILVVPVYATELFGTNGITKTVSGIAVLVMLVRTITWWVKLFNAFGMNPKWLLVSIGSIIPLVNRLTSVALIVLFWTMAFNKEYQYKS